LNAIIEEADYVSIRRYYITIRIFTLKANIKNKIGKNSAFFTYRKNGSENS
jgi:hypothetical protein